MVCTSSDYREEIKIENIYFHKYCCIELCQESTHKSITKTPARPQEELPILSTAEGCGDAKIEDVLALPRTDDDEEVLLIATINPASRTGNTQLHLVS